MNNINSSAFHSIISPTSINSTYYSATDAVKSSNIKMTAISIFIVLFVLVITGCVSMIYCYYVHSKSVKMQCNSNVQDLTPQLLSKEENVKDPENPDTKLILD